MFSKVWTTKFTGSFSDNIEKLRGEIKYADAIIIGAGAGMSASAGFTYNGERFERYFSDFHKKYGITDMYSGGFYPYETFEEYWAWWSRHILVNRYDCNVGKPYSCLLELVKDKNYFVLTTNVDHQFQKAGFDKKRLFYTQGDYGLWQCSKACHKKTYDNEKAVRQMAALQQNMKIPTELIPKCPVCGELMTMNLRCDDKFVQDEGWYAAASRYKEFVRKYKNTHILFLELGVGMNTPAIIKYPFWYMTAQNPKSVYACINLEGLVYPKQIEKQAVFLKADISAALTAVKAEKISDK